MAAPTRELEKLIVSRKLAHGGNPVTRWMAARPGTFCSPARASCAPRRGHVIGIDMDAALTLATARGHDLKVLSELLPAPRPVLSRRCAPTRADPIEA